MQNGTDLNPLFQAFCPMNWDGKSGEEKIEACQKLENHLAAVGGRGPYKVQNYDNATRLYNGFTDTYYTQRTDPAKKVIEVNALGLSSSFDTLWALVNASAYADQHEMLNLMEKAKEDHILEPEYKQALEKKQISETDMIVMKWEINSPIHPTHRNGSGYAERLVNLDAKQRSLEFLTLNYMRMGNERNQYKHPQTGDEVETSFKEYLDARNEYELTTGVPFLREGNDMKVGRDLVNSFNEQKAWLNERTRNGMFNAMNGYGPGMYPGNNILSLEERTKLKDVFLNGPTKLENFEVFNRVRRWEKKKFDCLEESEKTHEGEKKAEAKANQVTLDELEGKQQKKMMRSTHESTPTAPAKSRTCTML